MALDRPFDELRRDGLAAQVATLNARDHSAAEVLRIALARPGKTALVSSFGAESVVLLHMVARSQPELPVLFIDTGMLFAETLAYQQELAARLGLRDIRVLSARDIAAQDAEGALHQSDPDACCHLRKTLPLRVALAPFDAWITGRKRFQAGTRAALEVFEIEDETGRLKVNPLAHWTRTDVTAYMAEHHLPAHPLVARGYASIGCAPCTSPVAAGETPRAGRWRDRAKQECGIHFADGTLVRGGAAG